MKIIRLGKNGRVLSSQELANKIIEKSLLSANDTPLLVDFEGVEAFSQKFIATILGRILDQGVSISSIQFRGFANHELEAKARREFVRLAPSLAS